MAILHFLHYCTWAITKNVSFSANTPKQNVNPAVRSQERFSSINQQCSYQSGYSMRRLVNSMSNSNKTPIISLKMPWVPYIVYSICLWSRKENYKLQFLKCSVMCCHRSITIHIQIGDIPMRLFYSSSIVLQWIRHLRINLWIFISLDIKTIYWHSSWIPLVTRHFRC